MAAPSRKRKLPSRIELNLISTETKTRLYRKVSLPAVNPVSSTRGCQEQSCQDANQSHNSSAEGYYDHAEHMEHSLIDATSLGSQLHSDRQKSTVKEWDSIRENNIRFCVANQTFPVDQLCIMCLPNVAKAVIFCQDCSNIAYYCETCAIQLHERVNCYHNMLLWVVS